MGDFVLLWAWDSTVGLKFWRLNAFYSSGFNLFRNQSIQNISFEQFWWRHQMSDQRNSEWAEFLLRHSRCEKLVSDRKALDSEFGNIVEWWRFRSVISEISKALFYIAVCFSPKKQWRERVSWVCTMSTVNKAGQPKHHDLQRRKTWFMWVMCW